MSAISLRSGSCKQTSRTCAPRAHLQRARFRRPPRTCPRAISRLNLRLPSTLVRSPTITGRVSSSITSVSMPETTERRRRSRHRAAACPPPSAASSRMCSGVVPQHPPTRLTQPLSTKRSTLRRQHLGRLVVVAFFVGQARVGHAGDAESARFPTACADGRS